MNAVCRPLWAAACLLVLLLPGTGAGAQYLDGAVISARTIDAAAREKIEAFVVQPMGQLTAEDAETISKARTTLLRVLDDPTASPAFLSAISGMITARMDKSVNHDNELVRLNAIIIISRLTDEGSMALVEAGLEDDSAAVQRWAMEALRRRVARWKDTDANANRDKIKSVYEKVKSKLSQDDPPHPIVVTTGIKVLLAIDTSESRKAVLDMLDKRIALHTADPELSYSPEQYALQALGPYLATVRQFELAEGKALCEAGFRYAGLVLKQIDGLDQQDIPDTSLEMLYQCYLAMSQIAARVNVNAPARQANVSNMILNANWADVRALQGEWAGILKAGPFNLTDQDLGLQ